MGFGFSYEYLLQLLNAVNAVLPNRCSQWLFEEPDSGDYRVLAHRLPHSEAGYAIAHRTGVIGQVFRTQQAILVPDARNHTLYDAYDSSIDWELALPVRGTDSLNLTLNVEGQGAIALTQDLWSRIGKALSKKADGWRIPLRPPRPNDLPLFRTERLLAHTESDHARHDLYRRARSLAGRGSSVLLTGNFPELQRESYPTLAQAKSRHLSASYCFFALGGGLDHLATGPVAQTDLQTDYLNWWTTAKGRYGHVLVALGR